MVMITKHAIGRYKERFSASDIDSSMIDTHLKYLLKEAVPWGAQYSHSSSWILMATYDGREIYLVLDKNESGDEILITCLNRTQAYSNADKLAKHTYSKRVEKVEKEMTSKSERKKRKADRKKERRNNKYDY